MSKARKAILVSTIMACVAGQANAQGGIDTFDDGIGTWETNTFPFNTIGDWGNPGNGYRAVGSESFGTWMKTSLDPRFVGDYTSMGGPIEISVDIRVENLRRSSGSQAPTTRPLVVQLIDEGENNHGYPFTSVFATLGTLDGSMTGEWVTYSVVIEDPLADELPEGWSGYGYTDPDTGDVAFPPDRTFASVLANVETFQLMTADPLLPYHATDFEYYVDNISVRVAPAGGSILPLVLGVGCLGRRRRSDRVSAA